LTTDQIINLKYVYHSFDGKGNQSHVK